jgi:CHAD domain-containing protein
VLGEDGPSAEWVMKLDRHPHRMPGARSSGCAHLSRMRSATGRATRVMPPPCGYLNGVPHTHDEVERAFSPGPGADLPDLTELETVRLVELTGEDELDATYYDVPGLSLLRAGVTLRCRTGGADEGWHLKLPGVTPSARAELQSDLDAGANRPPAQLDDLVAGWSRGVALAPVARIRTHRRTSRLVGADGVVLAEVAEDQVEGHPAQVGAEPRRWREWEVELRNGDGALLDEVEEFLAGLGVPRSRVQRKLSLVLDAGPPEQTPFDGKLIKKSPAGLLLHRWLAEQVREIELLDPVVRHGGTGGIHGMRKACRRLRAALATFRPLVERERTDPIRDELRWLARSLGRARDDEVVLERIAKMLDGESKAANPPSARRVLDRYALTRAAQDQADVAGVLGSQRYFALRTALDALATEPPWTAAADQPARDVLPGLVRKEQKRVRRRHQAEDPHELRKAVKRLRYAYELVEPIWDKTARRPRNAARELTRVLGDRQDTLAARAWLVALPSEAMCDHEGAFVFGRLHALEEQHETALLEQVEPQWRNLTSLSW